MLYRRVEWHVCIFTGSSCSYSTCGSVYSSLVPKKAHLLERVKKNNKKTMAQFKRGDEKKVIEI